MRRLLLAAALLVALPAVGQTTTKVLGKRIQGPVCGDGVKNGSDVCDGSDFGAGVDCTDFGCTGGSLTCAVTCDEITTDLCTGCPVAPNLLVETFDGTNDPQAGYDAPADSWVESGTLYPNCTSGGTGCASSGCATGSGWSGQCLQLNIPAFTETRTRIDLPAAHAKVCSRVHLKWQSASFSVTAHDHILTVTDTASDSDACDPYCIEAARGPGASDFRLQMSMNPSSRNAVTQGGAVSFYPGAGGLTLPWQGYVEACFTNAGVGDSWEFRITECPSGVCGTTTVVGSGGGDISTVDGRRVILGPDETASYAPSTAVFFVESVALSDEGFIGED